MRPAIRPLGDRALLVELGQDIDPAVNERVQRLHRTLLRDKPFGVIESVPAYASLLVVYDPLRAAPETLKRHLLWRCDCDDASAAAGASKTVEIPVVYGGEGGPDLEAVAAFHDLPPQEVIRLHSSTLYRVYMIGFTPGFPYMGELPEALDTPRRETPRTHIPKGSVAIAQRQTGIYPVVSPGGWQIIGHTPMELFDPRALQPSRLAMGDAVRFKPVSPGEAVRWTG